MRPTPVMIPVNIAGIFAEHGDRGSLGDIARVDPSASARKSSRFLHAGNDSQVGPEHVHRAEVERERVVPARCGGPPAWAGSAMPRPSPMNLGAR